jgi:hypothetical protein
MLGSVLVFGPARKAKLLSTDDWARSGAEGFEITAAGPGAIADAIRKLVADYDGKRATPIGPHAWFGALYDWLENGTPDGAYDPLRDLLVRCVADNAPFHPNERMFGAPVPYRKVHSIRSATHETGIGGIRLRKALDHAGILRPGHETLADHEATFDAANAATLLNRLTTAMTLTEVASRLDIDWGQAKQLVDAGHVCAMDPLESGTANPHFARSDLDKLLDHLRAGAETVSSVPPGACDLPLAVRRAQCCLADMVGLVRGGSLRWIGLLADGNGLGSVLVDVAEVCSRLRRPELAGLTRREVEQTLGIPTRTVNALIETGFLGTSLQRHPTVPRNVMVIAKGDFDRFRERYVRMTDVAEMLDIPLRRVPSTLLARGIEPALTKVEFHATFYERRKIEALRSEDG